MTVTADEIVAWRRSLSNWGRWGDLDRSGTVNLVTPAKRQRAVDIVRRGRTVSCARTIDAGADSDDSIRPTHLMARTLNPDVASDYLGFAPHGYGVSHLDALGHYSSNGLSYNAQPRIASAIRPNVTPAVDVLRDGLVTRGVLVDIPMHRDRHHMDPGDSVTSRELRDALDRVGANVEPGDVLLVRTGRWARRHRDGPWDVDASLAGLHPETLPLLRELDLAALACDGISDVLPSVVEGVRLPIHEIALVSIGMHLLDNLDLEALAAACAEERRWEFLLMLAPLPIANGTGSPVNPIAMF